MRHFSGELNGIRLLMLDELEAVAGGDGEDADDIPTLPEVEVVAAGGAWAKIGEMLINLGIGYLGGLASSQSNESLQRETNVARGFNPSDVIENTWMRDCEGNVTSGWIMRDGSIYWDRNHNGMPDEWTWLDGRNNLWSVTGSGAQLIRAGT